MNCFGSIDMEATRVGEDSSLQKLIQMVEEAENKKAPMRRIVDKWAVWLVPIALLIAIGAFVVNWLLGLELMVALNRAVTVLVVFRPCAGAGYAYLDYGGHRAGNETRCDHQVRGSFGEDGKSGYDCI